MAEEGGREGGGGGGEERCDALQITNNHVHKQNPPGSPLSHDTHLHSQTHNPRAMVTQTHTLSCGVSGQAGFVTCSLSHTRTLLI